MDVNFFLDKYKILTGNLANYNIYVFQSVLCINFNLFSVKVSHRNLYKAPSIWITCDDTFLYFGGVATVVFHLQLISSQKEQGQCHSPRQDWEAAWLLLLTPHSRSHWRVSSWAALLEIRQVGKWTICSLSFLGSVTAWIRFDLLVPILAMFYLQEVVTSFHCYRWYCFPLIIFTL